jgi:hypothetical protein
LVSAFSVHADQAEAIRRGQEGFEFFAYALNALVAQDAVPGRTQIWQDFIAKRGDKNDKLMAAASEQGFVAAGGIGTPDDMRKHLRVIQDTGVDQVIFMQQAGRNKHEHICQSLELFAQEVMPEFKAELEQREKRKADELAPYIEAALRRKKRMRPLEDHEIPVVKAAVKKAIIAAA